MSRYRKIASARLVRYPLSITCALIAFFWLASGSYSMTYQGASHYSIHLRQGLLEVTAHPRKIRLPFRRQIIRVDRVAFELRWTTVSRPGWYVLQIPLWIPFGIAIVPTCACWMIRPYPPGCCPRCCYDLTGNVSGVCPECGKPIVV